MPAADPIEELPLLEERRERLRLLKRSVRLTRRTFFALATLELAAAAAWYGGLFGG